MNFCKFLVYGLIVMLGSVNFGISVGIPTPLAPLFTEWQKSDKDLLWYNIVSPLCGMFGPFIITFMLKYIGRRLAFTILHLYTAIIYVISLFMTKERFWIAIFSRVLVGLEVGGFTSLCPTILIEVAPSQYSGFFGNLHQIGVVLGITIMYLQGDFAHWKTLFYTGMVASLLGACLIWLCPETSPSKQKSENEESQSESLFREVHSSKLAVGLTLMVIQQFCGINAILSNLDQNFKDAGLALRSGVASSISMAAQMFGVLICGPIVDSIGRRPLFSISSLGCSIMLFLFALNLKYNITNYVVLIIICFYLFFFGLALGPIPWFIVPEYFSGQIRSISATLVTFVNQLCSFLVVFLYPWMKDGMGQSATIIFYGIFSAFGAIFGYFYIEEPQKINLENTDWNENDLDDNLVED